MGIMIYHWINCRMYDQQFDILGVSKNGVYLPSYLCYFNGITMMIQTTKILGYHIIVRQNWNLKLLQGAILRRHPNIVELREVACGRQGPWKKLWCLHRLHMVTHGYTWLHMVTELGRPLKRTPVIFVVRRVRQSGSVFLVFEYCEHDVGALSLGSSIHPAWRQMAEELVGGDWNMAGL